MDDLHMVIFIGLILVIIFLCVFALPILEMMR